MERRVAPADPTGHPERREVARVIGMEVTHEYFVEIRVVRLQRGEMLRGPSADIEEAIGKTVPI